MSNMKKTIALLSFVFLLFSMEAASAQCSGVAAANTMCASPNGAPGFTAPRAMVPGDLPTGTIIWPGDQLFKSCKPWADVRAWGAVGNGIANDTVPIQNAIAACQGTIFFPPGNYLITSTLNINNAGTCLKGASESTTNIIATTDITMIAFAASTAWSCLEKLGVFGFQNAAATQDLITVGTNALVIFRDCVLNGGRWGLNTAGVDGLVDNCGIAGWGSGTGNVFSTGANWYQRCKFDQGAVTVTFGFRQGVSPALAENHFVMCDFSGSFSNSSFSVDDGATNRAITIIEGSVFSSPIKFDNGKYASIIGGEIGSVTLTNTATPLSIVGSFGFSALTVTGAGTRSCAGNINITC